MTEREADYKQTEQYSRKRRSGARRRQEGVPFNEDFKQQLLPTRLGPALFWSVLLSLLSVGNPFLTSFATNIQSQNLYAGFAMQAGQSPYGDFFGTNGVLYYLIAFVGSFFDSSIGLAILQFVALLIAGIFFYKIVAYFSRTQETASNFSHWFYLFILALNFGGLYASIFALPFLLTSIWFLIRYFEKAVKDEAFILYGIDAALVFLIDPKSAVLWLVAFLVLLVYNAQHRQMARGFYQLLASLFGFLLIVYSVGYYTFVEQILGMAIQQTFFYNIRLNFGYEGILWTAGLVLGVLVVTGFLKHILMTIASLGQKQHTYIKVVVLLGFLVQTLFIIGNPNFDLNQLTVLFPYGFVMAVAHMKVQPSESEELEDMEGEEPPVVSYLKTSLFLPILACLVIPIQPIYTYFLQADVHQERSQIAQYIRENSEATDTIYAWDDSAQVYLQSERLAAATIITAEPYLNTEENQTSVTYDLNKNQASYIVVRNGLVMLEAVKANLEANYSKVDLGTSQLSLYQKN